MNSTMNLPWTQDEKYIQNLSRNNQFALEELIYAIHLLKNDRDIQARIGAQAHADFIAHAKNLALETARYEIILTTKALKRPDGEHAETLPYLQEATKAMADIVKDVHEIAQTPNEANQLRLKNNVGRLNISMDKVASTSGQVCNSWFTGLNLFLTVTATVLAFVLPSPLMALAAVISFGCFLASAHSSADKQLTSVQDRQDSFAKAATNLFAKRPQESAPSAPPQQDAKTEIDVEPVQGIYPKL